MAEYVWIGDLMRHMKDFKNFSKVTSGKRCKPNLFTLRFHLVDYVVDDIEQLGCLEVLVASPFRRFFMCIKRPYRAPLSGKPLVW